MTESKPTETKPNIALMSAAELERHIKEVDDKHRSRMKSLRALMRARKEEEAAK